MLINTQNKCGYGLTLCVVLSNNVRMHNTKVFMIDHMHDIVL